MLAFRSEGEAERWCKAHDLPLGAVFSPQVLWRLAGIWYDDRLRFDWKRRPVAERQALLEQVGLTGELWRIEPGE